MLVDFEENNIIYKMPSKVYKIVTDIMEQSQHTLTMSDLLPQLPKHLKNKITVVKD